MIVVLRHELFEAPHSQDLSLLALLALGQEPRHAMIVARFRRSGTQPINVWLKTLPPELGERICLILEQGPELQVRLPGEPAQIEVGNFTRSDWRAARLNLEDAIQVLQTPLKLLLENRWADLQFLLFLATPEERRTLESALSRGWLEVEHGGGLGDMTRRMRELSCQDDPGRKDHWIARMRLWLMYDRDSAEHDRRLPSRHSSNLRELAERFTEPWPLPHHQLERRAIENYLPRKVLEAWINLERPREAPARRALVGAFFRCSPQVRAQYNMKRGLLGDIVHISDERRRALRDTDAVPEDRELDMLFRRLTAEGEESVEIRLRRHLKSGFGERIAELFELPGIVEPAEIQREVGVFRDRLFTSIFARM